MKTLLNIMWLGLKEIRSLMSDVVMVLFVVYAFTLAIYIQATGTSSEVNNASIGVVDEDRPAAAVLASRGRLTQLVGRVGQRHERAAA